MPRPQTQEEFLTAGYVFLQSMTCQVCGEPTEQFRTPDGRFIEMNPMHQLDSKPVLHSTTCQGPEDKDDSRGSKKVLSANISSGEGDAGRRSDSSLDGDAGANAGRDSRSTSGTERNSKGNRAEWSKAAIPHAAADQPAPFANQVEKTYGTDKIPQAKPLSVEEAQSLAFTPGAWKHVARPVDMPPKEAIWNIQHSWWNWLDKSEPLSKVASLKEAIP